jgi:hypothetical protein
MMFLRDTRDGTVIWGRKLSGDAIADGFENLAQEAARAISSQLERDLRRER